MSMSLEQNATNDKSACNYGPATPTITNEADFKFWALNNRDAAALLKEIIFHWRGSSGRLRDRPEKFTVYPHSRWAKWMDWLPDQDDADIEPKLLAAKRRKVQREIKKLKDAGLILSIKHPFAGAVHHAYLTPTESALHQAQGYAAKKSDIDAYQKSLRPTPAVQKVGTPVGSDVVTHVGTPVVTNTSFPPSPSSPTLPKKGSQSSHAKKGEGLPKKTQPLKKEPATDDLLEKVRAVQKQWKGSKDKKGHVAALLALMPRQPNSGPLKHHADSDHEIPWRTWSPEKLVERYRVYLDYVTNWQKAHKKPSKIVTAEDIAQKEAAYDEWEEHYLLNEEKYKADWHAKQANIKNQSVDLKHSHA